MHPRRTPPRILSIILRPEWPATLAVYSDETYPVQHPERPRRPRRRQYDRSAFRRETRELLAG
jgi:hypothetical protein